MSTNQSAPSPSWLRCVPAALGLAAAFVMVAAAAAGATPGTRDDTLSSSGRSTAGGPTRDEPEPTAGAPYYLHFGPTGRCVVGDDADWHAVPAGGMWFHEASRGLAIESADDAETLIEIETVDQGTASVFDDQVLVRISSYPAGPDVVVEDTFPMWLTDGDGPSGGYSTGNTPKELYLRHIEVQANTDGFATALVNETRIPMAANGWFAPIEAGVDGFYGGGGPDCVRASNQADVLLGRGGDDFLIGKYADDLLIGGDGDDTLQGGGDDDELRGQDGADRLEGGSNDDCHNGGQDGRRDVYDDVGTFDGDTYVGEPGTLNGEPVSNIEYVVGGAFYLATTC